MSILTDTGRRSITNTEGPCEVCQGPIRHRHGSCTRPLPNRLEFPPWHFAQHHQPRHPHPYHRPNGGVNKGRGGRGRGAKGRGGGRNGSAGPSNTPQVRPTLGVAETPNPGAIQLLTSNPDQPTPTLDASPESPVSDPDGFSRVEALFQEFNNHNNIPKPMDE